MAQKKYLSLDRLTEYDDLIKSEISKGDESTLTSAKKYADGLVSGGHNHDDRYYTETEIDTKLSGINTSITNITNGTVTVKEAEHAGSADEATHATTADSATSATSATKATQDGNGKVIVDTYETKTDASAKLAEAKAYTDATAEEAIKQTSANDAKVLSDAKTYADNAATTAANKVKDELLNGAGGAYDTLKELGDLIVDNADAIEALEKIASSKADAEHTHAIADVSGLQDALNGKADASHGTHVEFDSTNKPKMDGTAAFGTSTKVARADHVHPTDTSRASQTDLDTHTSNTTVHITSTERTNWNAAKTHADSAHAPSNAQANVIESIKVNGTAQTITSKAVNITVPTKTSDLTHDSGFLVASDIANKANKATTLSGYGITDAYTKAEVDAKTVVDSTLSATSTNPVQNKVVNTAIQGVLDVASGNTESIKGHNDRILALESKVGEGFAEITSEEIQNLFK